MWPSVTYSNYFEIVSTVTFLDSRTEFISGMFLFNTVLLYHYTINTRYNICNALFTDTVITTCLLLRSEDKYKILRLYMGKFW